MFLSVLLGDNDSWEENRIEDCLNHNAMLGFILVKIKLLLLINSIYFIMSQIMIPVGNTQVPPVGNTQVPPVGNTQVPPVGNTQVPPVGNTQVPPTVFLRQLSIIKSDVLQ